GLVAVDLPADPQQLFVASVPKLNSDTDVAVFPASLPTTGELADELLSFDATESLKSPDATKNKSQRLLQTQKFDNQLATEAFEALFRKEEPDTDTGEENN